MNVVDDEKHLVFECPAFLHLRAARHELFSAAIGDDVRAFMRQEDQQSVFWHVLNCIRESEDLADVDHSLDVDIGVDVQIDTYE